MTMRTPEARWDSHVDFAKRGVKSSGLQAAILKYGAEAFELEQLDIGNSIEELITKEKAAIVEHATKSPSGYNLTSGGETPEGMPVTVEGVTYRSHKDAEGLQAAI